MGLKSFRRPVLQCGCSYIRASSSEQQSAQALIFAGHDGYYHNHTETAQADVLSRRKSTMELEVVLPEGNRPMTLAWILHIMNQSVSNTKVQNIVKWKLIKTLR